MKTDTNEITGSGNWISCAGSGLMHLSNWTPTLTLMLHEGDMKQLRPAFPTQPCSLEPAEEEEEGTGTPSFKKKELFSSPLMNEC